MADAPEKERMTETLKNTIDLAEKNLGTEEVVKLSAVMQALCLNLTDIETRYYVTFGTSGAAEFSLEDPAAEPMLTITTTAAVFHRMAMGESNPAVEFAMRKVKMSGVPMPKLARVGGNLIDTLFQCYKESA
jgi:putative sterol carrier protein